MIKLYIINKLNYNFKKIENIEYLKIKKGKTTEILLLCIMFDQ